MRFAVAAIIAAAGCYDNGQPHGQSKSAPRRGEVDAGRHRASDAAASACVELPFEESERLFVRCMGGVEQTVQICLAACDEADTACSSVCRSSAGRELYQCRATHLENRRASDR